MNQKTKDKLINENLLQDTFWLYDFKVLYQNQNLTDFFPTDSMSYSEKLNSIFRLTFYIAVILVIIKRSYLYMYIAIIGAIGTIILYKHYEHQNNLDKSNIDNFSNRDSVNNSNKICTAPSRQNPFMNLLISDIKENPDHVACKSTPKVKKEIEKNFNFNLYKDVDDVFNRRNSQRQFYTTPSTTLPNDQKSFAEWLYKVPSNCKSGDGNVCYNLQSPNMNLPNQLWKYTP